MKNFKVNGILFASMCVVCVLCISMIALHDRPEVPFELRNAAAPARTVAWISWSQGAVQVREDFVKEVVWQLDARPVSANEWLVEHPRCGIVPLKVALVRHDRKLGDFDERVVLNQ